MVSLDTPATSSPRSWIARMKEPAGIAPGCGRGPWGRRLAVGSPQAGAGAGEAAAPAAGGDEPAAPGPAAAGPPAGPAQATAASASAAASRAGRRLTFGTPRCAAPAPTPSGAR